MIEIFKEGRPVGGLESEIRTPIDVITAGQALLELARTEHDGIFHLAGYTRVSRLDLARAIATKFGFREDLVFKQSPGDLSKRAPRPRDASLDNRKVCAILMTPMLSLDQALALIVKNREEGFRVYG
jgi:dTDP-4-dehydrorhamnose reductase